MKKPFILVSMYRASNQKKTKIQPIKSQLDNYEKIIIMSPVWSALPVPAVNSAIDYLPAGKNVELIMVSGGGGTKKNKEKIKMLIMKKGCNVVGYTDLKAKRKNNKIISQILS